MTLMSLAGQLCRISFTLPLSFREMNRPLGLCVFVVCVCARARVCVRVRDR
jgi:hypothetical protein